MDDNKITENYRVDLYVGKDTLGDAKPLGNRVNTLVSRQLLCDMTANIEYNVWLLNQNDPHIDESSRNYDGLLYRNLNYLITGVRGSGKSTFLHYLIQCLIGNIDPFDAAAAPKGQQKRYTPQYYLGEARKPVHCRLLHRFDPTMPRFGKSSFLISVVAAIQSVLEQESSNTKYCSESQELLLLESNSVLKALDKGIARLSCNRDALSELSEFEVAHLRTENAELEEQIRGNFRRIMELLCRICHVSAFIVSIDDADTHFGQCAYVLENLRLYMTCPHLVVLMAGDRDLYLERIRELHFCEYNLDYHRIDKQGEKYRLDYVMNHANQYMIKLFPLENQYELRDLHYMTTKEDPIICKLQAKLNLSSASGYAECEIYTFVRAVFRTAMNSSDPCVENFVQLFLRMPLRSVLQVINSWTLDDVWQVLIDKGVLTETGAWIPTSFSAEPDSDLQNLRQVVKDAVFVVLQNEIRFADYNFTKIDLEHPRDFYLLMQVLCRKLNDAERGYFLTGASGNKVSDQYVALLLALSSHHHLRDFDSVLSYFMYGPASVSLYAKALKQYHKRLREQQSPYSLQKFEGDFSRYMHVGGWGSPLRWARHTNMIWASDKGKEAMHLGILRLRYSELMNILNRTIFRFSLPASEKGDGTPPVMDWSQPNVKSQLLKSIALYVSMSYSEDRDNSYFISVFNYMAFVLKCYQYCKQESLRSDSQKINDQSAMEGLIAMLRDNLLVKSCLTPEWLIPKEEEKNENNQQPVYSLYNNQQNEDVCHISWPANEQIGLRVIHRNLLQELAEAIWNWYKYAKQVMERGTDDLSPQKMASYWAAAYYHLKQANYSVGQIEIVSSSEFHVANRENIGKLGRLIARVTDEFVLMFRMDKEKLEAKAKDNIVALPAAGLSEQSNTKESGLKSENVRMLLGKFPLSEPFIIALKEYAKALQESNEEPTEKQAR